MKKRRLARELALEALYRIEMTKDKPEIVLNDVCSRTSHPQEVVEFARELVTITITNLLKIDNVISRTADNWSFDRLATLDRNILRAAICEIFYFPEIPFKVSIDEAIELAKKYSTKDSGRFVNGILDKVVKENGIWNNK